MIPDIKELNFPSYATLHQANVSLADMGDRTITAQVRIDGDIRPEFVGTDGEDWAVEFKGEKYIQPLRSPQAEKNNESRNSLVDLTFYHWAIYQLKRYYFVSLANTESGTAIADKYIVPLTVNLENFAKAIADILKYYFPKGEIYVYTEGDRYISPDATGYDTQAKTIDISYTYIWELLQKTQELYDCRWAIEQDARGNYAIKFGYDPGYIDKDDHTFRYGYEGGLLKFERQVQDADIRNQILGRGGEQNLPYLYFKDYEKFHPNSTDSRYSNYGQIPDPDAIPELENILFENLHDSNFRSYVQGWKTNPKRQLTTEDGWAGYVEAYDAERGNTDWAYRKGHEDERFNPVEYVKDDESIATYGLLQGGLDDQEDIYPSLQGMTLELPCIIDAHGGHKVETLADEVVAVEDVETDEIDASTGSAMIDKFEVASGTGSIVVDASITAGNKSVRIPETTVNVNVPSFVVPEGYRAYISPHLQNVKAWADITWVSKAFDRTTKSSPSGFQTEVKSFTIYSTSGGVAPNQTELAPGRYYIQAEIKTEEYIPQISATSDIKSIKSCAVRSTFTAQVICYRFDGTVLDNSASDSRTIAVGEDSTFVLNGTEFDVPEQGALMIEVPVEVTPKEWALTEVSTKVIRVSDGEEVNNADIPQGKYRTQTIVRVTNLDRDASHEFTASLLPTYLYYTTADAQWQPTFDIWVKNIFESDRSQYDGGDAGDSQYVAAIWEPLVSTQEMAVSFTTGNLSASSDWEFKVAADGIHYDNGKTIKVQGADGTEHEVRSEWRLTLIKSEAEADAIHKYVPYKDYNAKQGDRFFFTGIYLPWAYVYAAEKELTATKEAELDKTKEVQPTWVVTLDKLRINTIGEGETKKLIDRIHIGDHIWVDDSRFAPEGGLELYVTSITYDWQEGAILPDIEIVLSDEIVTSMSTVEQLQSSVEVMSNQLKTLTNIERIVRTVGDAAYLRKDGVTDTTYSETRVAKTLQSKNFRTGVIGGEGWGAYTDMNGNSVFETDYLMVRKDMQVNNLIANQIAARGGKEILSAASIQISQVEETEEGYVCYFEQHDGTVGNLFVVGDFAMSQVFDPMNEETKYYRRVVTAVGNNFVTLSFDDADGDGAPQEGDTLVQFGHGTDPARQFVIIRDVIGGGYERMVYGLDSVSASGKEYYFAGGQGTPYAILQGLQSSEGYTLLDSSGDRLCTNQEETAYHIQARWFVGDSEKKKGYAEWIDDTLTVQGTLKVLRDGSYQDVGTLISDVDGRVSDFDYLKNALALDSNAAVTQITGGLIFSKIIGVTDDSQKLVAGLNASSLGEDADHKTLMIFAGANGASAVSSALFRVYEDGHVVANDVEIFGKVTATELNATQSGNIAGFAISNDQLFAGTTSDYLKLQGSYITSEYQQNREEEYHIDERHIKVEIGPHGYEDDAEIQYGEKIISKRYVADVKSALTVGSRGTQNCGIYLDVVGDGVLNMAIFAEHGTFAGLRPFVRTVNESQKLLDSDHTLIISERKSSTVTLTLPDYPQEGQEYVILYADSSSDGLAIQSTKKYIQNIGDNGGPYRLQFKFTNRYTIHLVYCASLEYDNIPGVWIMDYYG